VDDKLNRVGPIAASILETGTLDSGIDIRPGDPDADSVADTLEMPISINDTLVVPLGKSPGPPETSQSPAVNDIDVIFEAAPLVRAGPVPPGTMDETYSPICPAAASSLVVVPIFADPPAAAIAAATCSAVCHP
jgi:hypothetical protein